MTDIATRTSAAGAMPRGALLAAAKEAAATACIVFLLAIYMVGFPTLADQGQKLGFVTRHAFLHRDEVARHQL